MIFVFRKSVDTSGKIIRPSKGWFQLSKNATALALVEKETHEADDTIYAHTEVRMALEKLFKDKCAYCEWDPTPGSDWNVEHYRPKAKVIERRNHPGYYWLTYKWENLYLVCTHCNQRRIDRPRWDDPVEHAGGGKATQFPLEDESTRAMSPSANYRKELTSLIDPCYDDPDDYLGFDSKGTIIALADNPYGKKTIEICNLNRRRLRVPRANRIKATIRMLRSIHKLNQQGNSGGVKELRASLNQFLLGDDCLYAAAARRVKKDPIAFGINFS